MLVYLSKTIIFGQYQQEKVEELAPIDFKVTINEADKVGVEDRAGNRENLEDLDCLIVRKI
jgi:hypothetical protein